MLSHQRPPTETVCATCIHFTLNAATKENKHPSVGKCRRFPPQVVYDVIEDAKDNTFPSVRTSDFCGEWMGMGDEE